MAHRFTRRYRPAWRAVVGALEATLVALTFACSGGGDGPTGPDLPGGPLPGPEQPGPGPEQPGPGPEQPGPGPEQPGPGPGPEQPGGIQGTYALVQINNSQPGQMVSVANPDGILIGLYRFDATTTLTLDPLQTFALELHYRDDKGEYGYDDHGEFKGAGQAGEHARPGVHLGGLRGRVHRHRGGWRRGDPVRLRRRRTARHDVRLPADQLTTPLTCEGVTSCSG